MLLKVSSVLRRFSPCLVLMIDLYLWSTVVSLLLVGLLVPLATVAARVKGDDFSVQWGYVGVLLLLTVVPFANLYVIKLVVDALLVIVRYA